MVLKYSRKYNIVETLVNTEFVYYINLSVFITYKTQKRNKRHLKNFRVLNIFSLLETNGRVATMHANAEWLKFKFKLVYVA